MLTERTVAAAIQEARKTGEQRWVHESRGRGQGALSLKISATGTASWYFRYALDRKNRYFPLGLYGDQADRLTLASARIRCGEAAARRQEITDGDLHSDERARLIGEQERKDQEVRAKAAAEAEALLKVKFTLKALMDAYIGYLENAGKSSADDVRRLVTLHVYGAFPDYSSAPARDLTRQQATEIFRKLVEAGKGRTAGKVRAFLHAAYELALGIEGDAAAPSTMEGFEIEFNPIAATRSLTQFNRVGHRHLSTSEFRSFWTRLSEMDSAAADAARVGVLAGGQRIAQLLRGTSLDYDLDVDVLTLFDGKGRRRVPRRHDIPLPPTAAAIVRKRIGAISSEADDRRIFGTTVPDTVGDVVAEISAEMVKSKEAMAPFGWTDLRRTVETLLIEELRVSKDLRGQILSHGLGGVQDRHYDRANYIRQMRPVLVQWGTWIRKHCKSQK
ncbi:DUF4102 domain-containing protein [Paraburkholderia fungorum]|uniref:integrase family protein n=1 Tax=Paraburkholderia fungorum TaxID=134537 RepID=UPI000481FB3A|nr:integrase family protein [Paraburkholderia fungorum]MBB5542455.1 integrase [Paraburkholderia fungorum]PNE57709.1 DUF4102 domain-containing protein [Paraburkholderia fungorum]